MLRRVNITSRSIPERADPLLITNDSNQAKMAYYGNDNTKIQGTPIQMFYANQSIFVTGIYYTSYYFTTRRDQQMLNNN